jgi:hypothetical protein
VPGSQDRISRLYQRCGPSRSPYIWDPECWWRESAASTAFLPLERDPPTSWSPFRHPLNARSYFLSCCQPWSSPRFCPPIYDDMAHASIYLPGRFDIDSKLVTNMSEWQSRQDNEMLLLINGVDLSMRYACLQGVVITWWNRALRGSTIRRLHYDWRAGTTLRGALLSGRHMGLLGVACIASTFVAVDGPLLQRASTVISVPVRTSNRLV